MFTARELMAGLTGRLCVGSGADEVKTIGSDSPFQAGGFVGAGPSEDKIMSSSEKRKSEFLAGGSGTSLAGVISWLKRRRLAGCSMGLS